MTALTDAIRGRGHWRIVVRPVTHASDRVPYASLRQTIERAAVQLRGWDFPHIDRQRAGERRGKDWIGSETDWSYYKESWSFYQSGQFVYLGGIHEDWIEDFQGFAGHRMPTEGSWLGVGNTLFRLTEIFEFAARLALTDAGADRMTIEVELRGIEGRQLWVEDLHRMPFDHRYNFHDPEFVYRMDIDRNRLVAESRVIAVEASSEVFARFGWYPERTMLTGQQDELRWGQP